MSLIIATHKITIKCLLAALIISVLTSCAGTHSQGLKAQTYINEETAVIDKYTEAGHKIIKAISQGNADSFNTALDKTSLLDRAFHGMPQNIHITRARLQMSTVLDKAGITITENLAKRSKLTFVQSRSVKEEHRALVRVDMGNKGLSYIDFILDKDENNTIRIVDWYDYAQGQLYSESLRQALVFILPRDNTLFATILGEAWIDSNSIERFSELAQLAQDNNYKEWIEQYKTLPEHLKYSRTVLVTRVLIASAAGAEPEYRSALKDVSTYLGDDPSLSLMLVDHYLNERDYASAHRSLNRLSEYTGGDAAIHLLKANVYLTEKDYTESLKYAQMAVKEDYGFEDAYWTLLAVSIYSHHYDIAVSTLRDLERQFGYEFDPSRLARVKGYEKFASSSIFADWQYGIVP